MIASAVPQAIIFFSLLCSLGLSVGLALAIWRAYLNESEFKWRIELDFNHFHEGTFELVLLTILPFVMLVAVLAFLL